MVPFGICDGVKIRAVHPRKDINAPPDPAITDRQCCLDAQVQQWAKAAPDTSSCRSCGHCPSCGRHSSCNPLKLRSSTSRLVKDPIGQSIRLVTQLPGSSSVCKAGSIAKGCKEAIWLPLRSKCLHSIRDEYQNCQLSRPYRDAQDRLLWRDKTCPARI